MKITTNRMLAVMVAGILIAAGAGLSFTSETLFSTGETWYSSTEISDTGVQHTEFYNQGTTGFTANSSVDSTSISKTMSADFSGFTVFSDLNLVNDVGGETTLSVSNSSMSLNKNVSMTANGLATNEDISLESEGEQNFRSEFVWWMNATMQKERSVTTPPLDFYQTQSTYNQGTGYYSTLTLSPYHTEISSSMSILSAE